MPEAPAHPDPALQATALRFAAGDLTPAEASAFEARLADDQDAREALSEAVRLSAAALRQEPPTPHRSFRAAIRERLVGCRPGWLARRAYRGHPLVWVGTGAFALAASALVGLSLAEPESRSGSVPNSAVPVVAVAPAPPPPAVESLELEPVVQAESPRAACDEETPSVAEIWAQLSTPDHVEKAHEDEMRWRQKFRDSPVAPGGRADVARDH